MTVLALGDDSPASHESMRIVGVVPSGTLSSRSRSRFWSGAAHFIHPSEIGTSACGSELPECVGDEVDVGTGRALCAGGQAPELILTGVLGQSGA